MNTANPRIPSPFDTAGIFGSLRIQAQKNVNYCDGVVYCIACWLQAYVSLQPNLYEFSFWTYNVRQYSS